MSDEKETLTLEEKVDLNLYALSALATSVVPNSKYSAEVLQGMGLRLPAPTYEVLKRSARVATRSLIETGSQVMADIAPAPEAKA